MATNKWIQMENIKVDFKIKKEQGLEFTSGNMELNTQGNGKIIKYQASVYLNTKMVKSMRVSLLMGTLMDQVFTLTKMAIGLKEHGKMVLRTGKDLDFFQEEISSKASLRMARRQDQEQQFIKMEIFTKESGKMQKGMEREQFTIQMVESNKRIIFKANS